MVENLESFFIGGEWVEPVGSGTRDVVDPATEGVIGRIRLGSTRDVDRAVAAAKAAFPAYSRTGRDERVELLNRIADCLEARLPEMAAAITREMGAPAWLATEMQAALGVAHLRIGADILSRYEFEERRGTTLTVREPIGVCALITPWNWPINQIAAKVVPALATGCTMVLKPSELAPLSAHLWAEILQEAGVPPGVFNLVDGTGSEVGAALSAHPDVDMVSFTGSTRAGVQVAIAAAPTVKRVCQELGGKSANIVLDDADVAASVTAAVKGVMLNSGQTCSALTRLIVPRGRMAEVLDAARAAAAEVTVGPPETGPAVGPLAHAAHWLKVQELIEAGVAEGATLVAGGPGRPDGLGTGYYARPTVFADVTPDMRVAQQEIFGPVLVIMAYGDVEEAIDIANGTPFGLSGGVQGVDAELVRYVASRLRTGQVMVNDAALDFSAPFGGYRQSGNGREWGEHAFAEYLETKAIIGMPD